MKNFLILPLVAALALVVSCQKQQSEEERKAEVERLVQERLAAEHQKEDKQRFAQQQSDLEAREKALVQKEAAAAAVKGRLPTPIEVPQQLREAPDVSEVRTTASYGTFYQKLEPYGAWRETSEYGYVWQPREAEGSLGWRPYTDGRWVYSDAGWMWVSDEAFGWATYHYGRWVRLRHVGWVWVPGEEWAPAWVSWRTSKDFVGWAPLPPEARFDRKHGIRSWADNFYDIGPDQYAFVPGNEFGSRRIQQSVVPIERNVSIVIETTNVTNISYTNTTIINLGPNYQDLRSRSHQPIERYRLEHQADADVSAPPTVRGDVLVVPVPAITTVQGMDRPRVKETITQATVEKNWAPETDPSSSERAREKMKAEVMAPFDPPSKTFVKPVPSSTSHTTATATPTPARAAPTPATATPTIGTPTPATVTPMPARATPTPASARTVTPTPTRTPRSTPAATATPRVRPTATAAPTPAVSGSPRPSPTPDRPTRTPPPRVMPTPMAAPTSRASSTKPAVKPTPSHSPAVKPLASPRVPQTGPAVTPPVKAAPVISPPNETKPAVRPTPPNVRPKQPATAAATPAPRTGPSPTPKDKKATPKEVKGAGQMEKTQPTPTAASK